jgi:hypothetical protein
MRKITLLLFSFIILSGLTSCNKEKDENPALTSGPWIGTWIQINFLSSNDNGVWTPDSYSSNGIGFVSEITKDEWIQTDDYGNGYSVSSPYTVYQDYKYIRGNDSGRLEFEYDSIFQTDVMYEYFDIESNQGVKYLVAFKYKRKIE